MNDSFIFHGQTTFIDKPRDTVIRDFQNTYLVGDGSDRDRINLEIGKLVEAILGSRDLQNAEKEEIAEALHGVAGQVKEGRANKITVKGTLEAVREIVSKAADIAGPALSTISAIMSLFGLK